MAIGRSNKEREEIAIMDPVLIIILTAIIGYGALEYRKRDREYRSMILQVSRGEVPIRRTKHPALWKLFTLAGVEFLAVMLVLYAFWTASRPMRQLVVGSMILLGVFFSVIVVLLGVMLVRDIREYRARPAISKEELSWHF
jgi:hypothetical protein